MGGNSPVGYHRELVDRLAELRAACGNPSYREIARRTPTSAGHISDVFNGRKVPSADMAASIAKALCVDQNEQKRLRWYAERALGERVRRSRDTGASSAFAAPVRSAYVEQVHRIAPPRLVGRDDELRELERFCTVDDWERYVWWRAAAWAGKSALMAWFVLHPPPGTRMVSFFITARFAGQSDRTAFAEVLMEQLAELLERPIPVFVTPATRDGHLLAMLGDAARACRQRGQRLVLVVDGMDEDRGVVAGPDAYSIAALLPARPPAGMQVIVAGRPNPPVPSDVPDDHPLRDPGIVRVLDESPHAKVIRADAERELDRLLDGTPAEQDLLGLLTAAGGGLSGTDLAELTGWSPRQVDRKVHTVAGRTFARRASGRRYGAGPEVYLLGHEELQASATRFLGRARLAGYRERMHTWAGRYRDRGWPEDTPEYLLRGYHRMLHDAGDLPRMIDHATDTARHNRMLDFTGADSAALAEIATTMDAVLHQHPPDLVAMGRLAVHRDYLAGRNNGIPTDLPAVWAMLGQVPHAEALTQAITDPQRRARALSNLVKAVAGGGAQARAQALAASITDPEEQQRAWTWIVLAAQEAGARAEVWYDDTYPGDGDRAWMSQWAAAGRHELPETIVESHGDPETDALRWAWALQHAAADEDEDPAETVDPASNDPYAYDLTVADALLLFDEDLDQDEFDEGIDQDEAAAWDDPDPGSRAWMLSWVAADKRDESIQTDTDPAEDQAWVLRWTAAREHEHAESVVWSSGNPKVDELALARVLEHATGADNDDPADAVTEADIAPDEQDQTFATWWAADEHEQPTTVTNSYQRVRVLINRAMAGTRTGDHDRAAGWTDQAEGLSRAITDPHLHTRALLDLATLTANQGDHDRAQTLARLIADPDHQARAFTMLAAEAARREDHGRATVLADRAETLARSITDWYRQVRDLTTLFEVVTATGDCHRAAAVADRVATLSRRIADPHRQTRALINLIQAVAVAGDHQRAVALADRAEDLAHSTDPDDQSWQLPDLAEVIAGLGDHDRAETLARSITDPYDRATAFTALVKAATQSGDHERAAALADQAERHIHSGTGGWEWWRPWALANLAAVVAALGQHDWAETLARSITDPRNRATAFTALVKAATQLGDHERAAVLADQAELAAQSITDPYYQPRPLAGLAAVVADLGHHDRAETLARSIPNPHERARALTALATALASAGNRARAEAVARSIPNPYSRARALTTLATMVAEAGDRDRAAALTDEAETLTGLIADPGRRAEVLSALARHVDPNRAQRLIAQAFRLDNWTTPLHALARVQPAAVTAMTDERLRLEDGR